MAARPGPDRRFRCCTACGPPCPAAIRTAIFAELQADSLAVGPLQPFAHA
ncbi:hypothetical protein [Amycolatopsis jejuensis]|nr:hypothetical protein [Amycolatopsis jejuensis]